MTRRKRGIHAPDPETAFQPRAVLGLLRNRRKFGATTAELGDHAGSYAVATIISGLRSRGHRITATYEAQSWASATAYRKVYRYRLEE